MDDLSDEDLEKFLPAWYLELKRILKNREAKRSEISFKKPQETDGKSLVDGQSEPVVK